MLRKLLVSLLIVSIAVFCFVSCEEDDATANEDADSTATSGGTVATPTVGGTAIIAPSGG